MSKFKIGEIAVVFSPGDKIHLSECVVTVGLQPRKWEGHGSMAGRDGVGLLYEIEVQGEDWLVYPHELIKKKPPEETTTWEAIQEITNWNPNKEKVE